MTDEVAVVAEVIEESEESRLPAVASDPKVLPFSNVLGGGQPRATERIEMARAATQVLASFEMAVRNPRDEQRCFDKIMKLCENVYFASDALYKVPRAGGNVEGISTKGAQEFARIWGNLDVGFIEHGAYPAQDGQPGVSQFEAYCYDLESNYRRRQAYTVQHGRWANNAFKLENNPDEIRLIAASRTSKECRNAILRVLPHWVSEEAFKRCKRTLFESVKDVHGAWNAYLKWFAEYGVSEDSLWRYLAKKKDPDKLDAADIVDLRMLRSAVLNGEEDINQVFPERNKRVNPSEQASSTTSENQVSQSTQPATEKPTNKPNQKDTAAQSANKAKGSAQSTPKQSSQATSGSKTASSAEAGNTSPAPAQDVQPTSEPSSSNSESAKQPQSSTPESADAGTTAESSTAKSAEASDTKQQSAPDSSPATTEATAASSAEGQTTKQETAPTATKPQKPQPASTPELKLDTTALEEEGSLF